MRKEKEEIRTLATPLMVEESTAGMVARALRCLADDPVGFNRLALGRPDYWEGQRRAALALTRARSVVVATGNAVGKSYLAAGLTLWWLYTHPGSLVVATAPSQGLLGTVLFRELQKALAASRRRGLGLPGMVVGPDRGTPFSLRVGPGRRLAAEGWGCLGIATRGVERLAGRHHADLMVVVDEASGVQPEAWEALTSLNPRKLFVCGNPLTPGTVFHKLHQRGLTEASDPSIPDHARGVALTIPSTASPDINLERSPRGLADRGFIREAERQWGRGSPLWLSHVEGVFPTVAVHALIEPGWLDQAASLERSQTYENPPGQPVLGCDLAAGVGADRTAIVVRDEGGIRELIASDRLAPDEAATLIASLARKHLIAPERILYDGAGLGAELTTRLARQGPGFVHARAIFGAASGGAGFLNHRAWCGWRLRQRLDPSYSGLDPIAMTGGEPATRVVWDGDRFDPATQTWRLPPDDDPTDFAALGPALRPARSNQASRLPFVIPPEPWWPNLREELEALRYRLVGTKLALEDKRETRRRLGRSPDLADALLITFSVD